jgi:phosphatidylglycerophosphate synthase
MQEQALGFVVVGPDGGHRLVAGGLTILERVVRGLAKRGVRAVQIPGPEVPLPPDLGVAVEWVAPGAVPPAGAVTVPGDEVAGVRVTDEASALEAERALCRAIAKSHQGPIDALINWRFSSPITRRLSRTPVTPNMVTFAGLFVGAAACACLLAGGWAAAAAAGVLLQVHSILDSCDGELARLRFQFSRMGQWFDNLADDLVDNLFILAAGAAAGGVFVTLAALGAGGRLFTNGVVYRDVYRRTGTGDLYAFRLWFERDKRTVDDVYDPRSWMTWARALGRRDTYVFGWMLMCLAGLPAGVAVWGAALGVAETLIILLHLGFRAVEVSRSGQSR